MVEVKPTSDPSDQCGSCGDPAHMEVRIFTYPQLVHSTKYCKSCAYVLMEQVSEHLGYGILDPNTFDHD